MRFIPALLFAASLAACQTTPDATTAKPSTTPAPVKTVFVPVVNPTVLTFDRLSVVLDDAAKEQLRKLADFTNSNARVVLTGFADRRQVANPQDGAIARAIAVRDEMIRLGATPSKIIVRINNDAPGRHAVDVEYTLP